MVLQEADEPGRGGKAGGQDSPQPRLRALWTLVSLVSAWGLPLQLNLRIQCILAWSFNDQNLPKCGIFL